MKSKSILPSSATELARLIQLYFEGLEGKFHYEEAPTKTSTKVSVTESSSIKIWDVEPQPPTLSGLIYYLGFFGREEFEQYEACGRHAHLLKRARLQIETVYEKKLHYQSPTGAIFALKNMGWTDKADKIETPADASLTNLTIDVKVSGPAPAQQERDVVL